jgi:ethylbenzene dioxygenase beta subunit
MACAEDRPSRPRRLIGNLGVVRLEDGEVQTKTAFLVDRSRLETNHQLLSGHREDLLRKVNGARKVRSRTMVLDANVMLDKNLSVFLFGSKPHQRDANRALAEIDHNGR